MANVKTQLDITNDQLKELARNGSVEVSRKIGAYALTFTIVLDEKREAICAGVKVSADDLPIIGWPTDRAHNYIVPVFTEKKGNK